MSRSLSGRTAWVIGAASGIGEASAIALARAGAHVVLTGRRDRLLAALEERIRAGGGSATTAAGDISNPARVAEICAAIGKEGGLDILVNSAGTNLPGRRWDELTPEAIAQLLESNLHGALYVAHAVLPLMRGRRKGLLIHIASWAAHFISATPGPVYTASKSAIVAMSHTINLENRAFGIRSSVLSPADTRTPMMDRRPQPMSEEAKRRMLDPADIAELVVYLATLPPHVCIDELIVSPT